MTDTGEENNVCHTDLKLSGSRNRKLTRKQKEAEFKKNKKNTKPFEAIAAEGERSMKKALSTNTSTAGKEKPAAKRQRYEDADHLPPLLSREGEIRPTLKYLLTSHKIAIIPEVS